MDKLDLKTKSTERLFKLRRYVQLAPQDPDIRFALARALAQDHLSDEAATELHKVIALAPNHLDARKLLKRLADDAQGIRWEAAMRRYLK